MESEKSKIGDTTVGSRLAQERVRLGLNQGELASALGISKVTASLYESNKHMPGGEVLLSLHRLGADIVFILSGSKAPETALNALDLVRLALSLQEARRQVGLSSEGPGQRELLDRAWVIYLALERFLSAETPEGHGL